MSSVKSKLAVECKGVSKYYVSGEQEVTALDNVSVTIQSGEFTSLSGPSGSGKTTLLNLIGGLDEPSSGEVWVAGRRIDLLNRAERAELRLHSIGFVFQAYNLIPVLTARENVEFVLELQGVGASERGKRAKEMLQAVGLGGFEDRRPTQLSGGQQQRVAVARAVCSNPALVLADEPTANLDSATAIKLLDLMLEMNRSLGVTFVFSTHDKLVMERARRIVQLQDGKIVADQQK